MNDRLSRERRACTSFRTVALRLAGRQHGVVALRQLRRAGISDATVAAAIGRFLFRLHRGVYSVGRPRIDRPGLWAAGVLAAGEGAVLGYRSAAAFWGFVQFQPHVEVIRKGHRQTGRSVIDYGDGPKSVPLTVRSTRDLPDIDLGGMKGIPLTSPERTLLDLSGTMTPKGLKRAFFEADRLDLLDDARLGDCIRRCRGRPGSSHFRKLSLNRLPFPAKSKSVLELLFLDICRDAGITKPAVNRVIGDHEADCVWQRQRLVVELDSYEFHRGREAFERDLAQTNRLRSRGWSVLRFSWRMVTNEPQQVADQVRRALAAGGP